MNAIVCFSFVYLKTPGLFEGFFTIVTTIRTIGGGRVDFYMSYQSRTMSETKIKRKVNFIGSESGLTNNLPFVALLTFVGFSFIVKSFVGIQLS